MSSETIDYRAVEVPDGKGREEYSYAERRAELLQHIEAAGSPRLLNYAELGRYYGVSREQIRKDVERLSEYVDESLGETEALEGEALFHRCIAGLLEEEDWKGAASVFKDLAEWRRQGDLEDLMGRVEALERERVGQSDNPFRVK